MGAGMKADNKKTRKAGENVLSLYFKEISSIPLLSRTEEDSLARRAGKGDRLAKEKIIQANLRFVVSVAKTFHAHDLPLEDLVSEGNIGLITALEHFDPERGYRFISYAVWWIRQAIRRAIDEKSRMIRLPQNKAQELLRISKELDDLAGEPYRKPEVEMVARRIHSDSDSVAALLNVSRDMLSFEAPLGAESSFSSLEDFVQDKNSSPPEEILISQSLRDDINSVLTTLSQRESEILQHRFGLNGRRPMSLREIGRACRLTKERIRQIEKKAIKRLRHPSYTSLLRAYK